MVAVAIEFGVSRAGDRFGGSVGPPAGSDGISSGGEARHDFCARVPEVTACIAMITSVRTAKNHPLRPGGAGARWKTARGAFSRELHRVHIDAGGLGVRVLRATSDDLQHMRAGRQPVLVIEHLFGAGRGIPAIDRHELLDAIHEHVCLAAQRLGAANQAHLIPLECHDHRGILRLGETHGSEESGFVRLLCPCAFIGQCAAHEKALRVFSGHRHALRAIVADLDDRVAIGESPDNISVSLEIVPAAEGPSVRGDFFRDEGQPQYFLGFRRCIKRGVFNSPRAVTHGVHNRGRADDVVLAAGAKLLRQPPDCRQHPAQRQRMGDVQPTAVDDDAAVYVVLRYAGLMDVVGLENHLAIGQFACPGIVCLDSVLRHCPADKQWRIPE